MSVFGKTLWSVIVFGLAGFVVFAALELTTRTILFPEWVGLSPRSIGNNPYFGVFNEPNLNLRRFSPANYNVVNTTNKYGFRDRREGFEEDLAGTWIFGDSNTFAIGLNDDEAFTGLLDARKLPVANMAGLGLDLPKDLQIINKMAELGARPKAVLLVSSMNYDLIDPDAFSQTEEEQVKKQGPASTFFERLGVATRLEAFAFLGIKSILLRNVALYGYVKSQMIAVPALRDWLKDKGFVQDIDIQYRGLNLMLDKSRRSDVEAAAAIWADEYLTIKKKVQEEFNARFAVVLLPEHHHLYPSRMAKFMAYFNLAPETQDAAQPYDALKAALEARGIFVVDVLTPLRAANDPQLIFYNDSHYNRKGHAIFADTIADWITSGGSD